MKMKLLEKKNSCKTIFAKGIVHETTPYFTLRFIQSYTVRPIYVFIPYCYVLHTCRVSEN